MSEFKKFDGDKPQLYRLANFQQELGEICNVMQYGAEKYGDNNWKQGATWSRYFSALMRHLWAWWRGEDIDPESGFNHLAHVGANVLFIYWYFNNNVGEDNR